MKRLAVLALAMLGLAACGGGAKGSTATSSAPSSKLAKTAEVCTDKPVIDSVRSQLKYPQIVPDMAKKAGVTEDAEWALIADGLAALSADNTLVIKSAGMQSDGKVTDTGLVALAIEQCVLDGLDASTAVRQHISTTRALDGQQTDKWDGYAARWTYHPDDGLNITITES